MELRLAERNGRWRIEARRDAAGHWLPLTNFVSLESARELHDYYRVCPQIAREHYDTEEGSRT